MEFSRVSTSSAAQSESLEAEVDAFLRGCKGGTRNNLKRKKAEELVNKLDTVHHQAKHLKLYF